MAQAIRALRDQIAAAQLGGEGEEVRFGLGPIDLECQLVMSRDTGGAGGINIGVVSLSATGKADAQAGDRVSGAP